MREAHRLNDTSNSARSRCASHWGEWWWVMRSVASQDGLWSRGAECSAPRPYSPPSARAAAPGPRASAQGAAHGASRGTRACEHVHGGRRLRAREETPSAQRRRQGRLAGGGRRTVGPKCALPPALARTRAPAARGRLQLHRRDERMPSTSPCDGAARRRLHCACREELGLPPAIRPDGRVARQCCG